MKKRKALLALFFAAFFTFTSCETFLGLTLGDLGPYQFYTIDVGTGAFLIVDATIAAQGRYSVVWAERGSGVTQAQAQAIADEFDGYIRRALLDAFCGGPFSLVGKTFCNILSFANWLAGGSGGDNRLTVLLLDIRGGRQGNAIVAGYFFSGDFLARGRIGSTRQYSNGRDIIYVNSTLLPHFKSDLFSTIAHELMHLINFATTVRRHPSNPWNNMMDTWIDEGLAMTAEQIYRGANLRERVAWFTGDPLGTIALGNNFFVWGNHANRPGAILDDYATAYLFFRWLGLHAKANLPAEIYARFFYNMIVSPERGTRVVTEQARLINPDWANWDVLLKTWLAANYDPGNRRFGYIGDADIFGAGVTRGTRRVYDMLYVALFPGEGVFSRVDGFFVEPRASGNIRHVGLTSGAPVVGSGFGRFYGDTLLTFNANPDNSPHARAETGRLTGAGAAAIAALAEPYFSHEPKGPLSISAWDALGRDFERPNFAPREWRR